MITPPMLQSIQVGLPRTMGPSDASDPQDKPWTSGFRKEPVSGAVWLGRTNLVGDGQADLENHGGPDKAVNVYPSEHYPDWREQLGLTLPYGAFGENFTTSELIETDVCIGDIYEVGNAVVQISQPRQPCWKLARRWRIKDLAARVIETGRTGWYLRVLTEGTVAAGLPLRLVERPHPEWTIAAANEVMHHRQRDAAHCQGLAACAALSHSWRAMLNRQCSAGT